MFQWSNELLISMFLLRNFELRLYHSYKSLSRKQNALITLLWMSIMYVLCFIFVDVVEVCFYILFCSVWLVVCFFVNFPRTYLFVWFFIFLKLFLCALSFIYLNSKITLYMIHVKTLSFKLLFLNATLKQVHVAGQMIIQTNRYGENKMVSWLRRRRVHWLIIRQHLVRT